MENNMIIESLSKEELKQLAIDLRSGKVFSDLHAESEMLLHIFMPLIFMGPEQLQELAEQNPGLMFEYLDKAEPRGINGYPSFFSVRFLTMEDTSKVFEYIKKLEEAENSIE